MAYGPPIELQPPLAPICPSANESRTSGARNERATERVGRQEGAALEAGPGALRPGGSPSEGGSRGAGAGAVQAATRRAEDDRQGKQCSRSHGTSTATGAAGFRRRRPRGDRAVR